MKRTWLIMLQIYLANVAITGVSFQNLTKSVGLKNPNHLNTNDYLNTILELKSHWQYFLLHLYFFQNYNYNFLLYKDHVVLCQLNKFQISLEIFSIFSLKRNWIIGTQNIKLDWHVTLHTMLTLNIECRGFF